MKLFYSLIVLLIFSNSLSAHKDKIKIKNFGNVKTLYISEFNFGEKVVSSEELKMEVLGELSRRLAENMGFKDTIMIERKTFLSLNKSDVYIIEKNDTNYKFLKLNNDYTEVKGGSGIAVRILSPKVDVEQVLKLVEFAIINKNKLNKYLIKTDYYFDEEVKISISANTVKFIAAITSKESAIVKTLLQIELLLFKDNDQIVYWVNNEFCFKMNLERFKSDNVYKDLWKDELKVRDFKYYIQSDSNNFFVVFTNEKLFSFFDGNEDHEAIDIEVDSTRDMYPFGISREKIMGKIIIYNRDDFFIYDIHKKKLQKIE